MKKLVKFIPLIFILLIMVSCNASGKEYWIRYYSSHTKQFMYEERVLAGSRYLINCEKKKDQLTYASGDSVKDYNFLGWTKTSSRLKTTSPDYKAGNYIVVNNNIRFYDVMFPVSEDKPPDCLGINNKYSHIIFVGDSRFHGTDICLSLENIVLPNVSFIAKNGQTISGFINDGSYDMLRKQINSFSKSDKIAVVINLGVNDLTISKVGYPADHAKVEVAVNNLKSLMDKIKNDFKNHNIKLCFVSLNPCGFYMNGDYNGSAIQHRNAEDSIVLFNNMMKEKMCIDIKYIDSWSFMTVHGYFFKQTTVYGGSTKKYNDGLHYSLATNLRVLNFIIRKL